MKVVILCGGQGTRIRDVSEVLPKPMLPVGNRPILWHIMKIYSRYGYNDFVLCLGYKGWLIKEFFLNYHAKTADITVNLGINESIEYHQDIDIPSWKVTMVETGENTNTAGRIWKARQYLDTSQFAVTYGDGVADINVHDLVKHHKKFRHQATITGVQPLGRFGEIEAKDGVIQEFNEKPNVSKGLINGGFMIFNREVLDKYFKGDESRSLENDCLPQMVKDKRVGLYRHSGQWYCIDTPREYQALNDLWRDGKAFWDKGE